MSKCIYLYVADSYLVSHTVRFSFWLPELSLKKPKSPSSISGGAKVLGTDGICKYLPVSAKLRLNSFWDRRIFTVGTLLENKNKLVKDPW